MQLKMETVLEDLHRGWASVHGARDNPCPQKIKQELLKYDSVEFKI